MAAWLLQQQLRLDRQAEIDRQGGSDKKSDIFAKENRREGRARCGLFREWQVKHSSMENLKEFFGWLRCTE